MSSWRVRVISEPSNNLTDGDDSSAEFDALRRLLIGPEQSRIDELSEEIQSRELTPQEIAEHLPDAIALRGGKDNRLGRALGPAVESALRESIRRDPREMAAVIFPVLGPAIRKAIAEALSGLVRSINTTVDQSLSLKGLRWRVESWRTGVPFPEIVLKHALVYRVEQAFLVHAETGLLLLHVAAANLKVPDADLISGMLSAIQDFVRDSFRPAEGATLRTFSVGELTVQVEAGPRALLALVIRGQAPDSVLRRQQDTLETIHRQFANELAHFTGDAAPFESARPLLESCLDTVLASANDGASQRLAWMRWALPLMLTVVVAGALLWRSTARWHHALAALRAEPGIVVLEASRGLHSWTISGLRDPDAREPAAVVAAAGVSAPRVTGRWEQYLSLDQAMVTARARHAMDSLSNVVTRTHILFAAGSAELDPAAIAQLAAVATRLQQLDGYARLSDGAVRLELTGRTDPSGSDATNATLARQRVDAVSRWLAASGIDAARIVANAVATSVPLAAPDSSSRARINRSVSLRIVPPVPAPTPRGQ
ncbi:MAG: OmpA family protein [Gemmatimonadaceae bacterium]